MIAWSGRRRLARAVSAFLVAGLIWLLPIAARAEFPDKPIRLIVPQAPGSATDTVARILASELGPQLNQTIIVENRPGAAFTIGLDIALARCRDVICAQDA